MEGRNLIMNLKKNLEREKEFENPGGGISTIKSITEKSIVYMRGNSRFYLNFSDIEQAYSYFKGKICTTNDLKEYKPQIFDSKHKGHSCNCTFFFLLLKHLDLIEGDIQGSGRRGNPFYIKIK
ncbi:hypothetical protein [Crassaminicella indica]|uniref:Uncharacterized protein n=1 Tax=Crassaminicella indica TaxID=2855394 RepID=A0ABX8RBU4_9CLOT|nr:hypothetical protein [Crassaminicella indica]QXM05185.1 hypothetical protein KVH43_07205 [Crassaminicella indica]